MLDVRDAGEWESGVIEGSLLVPYHDIHQLPDGIDGDTPVAVICSSGQRAAVGASLVQRFGGRALHVVDGGVGTWQRNGWPTVPPG